MTDASGATTATGDFVAEDRTPPGRLLSLIPWVPAGYKRGLGRSHIVLLLLLSAAAFFDGYDTSVKSLALTQIRDTFDLSKAQASALLAVVYIGALPAMAITRWADRVGRRRMLLISVLGYTTFSGLTALAPNAATYATLQFCQQVFLVADRGISTSTANGMLVLAGSSTGSPPGAQNRRAPPTMLASASEQPTRRRP